VEVERSLIMWASSRMMRNQDTWVGGWVGGVGWGRRRGGRTKEGEEGEGERGRVRDGEELAHWPLAHSH
jgi:hypothetical protein